MKFMQVRTIRCSVAAVCLTAVALITTGCLSPVVTPEECPQLNPHTLENKGYQDGKLGKDRSNELVAECAKVGVPVDILSYRKGFEVSMQTYYCTAANARHHGEHNYFFNYQQCPSETHAGLDESWRAGKEIYRLDKEIEQDAKLQKELRQSIQDTQSGKERVSSLYEKTSVLYLLRAEEQEVQERLNYKKALRARLSRY